MAALPSPESPTVMAIYGTYKPSGRRPHMGASIIGHPCSRYIWGVWRWCDPTIEDGRVLRLFDSGHREESRIVNDLRNCGVEVHTQGEDGKQFAFVAHDGHFAGSMDGAARGVKEHPQTWCVLEVKTANLRSFRELAKLGVREAKPQHYAQVQVYMANLELESAYYVAVCKDSDELFGEWISHDKSQSDALMDKAKRLINARAMPAKVFDDRGKQPCMWCPMQAQCYDKALPAPSCRTCVHAETSDNGKWHCSHHMTDLPYDRQLVGCDDHLYLPEFLANIGELVQEDDHSNVYEGPGGVQFANVASVPAVEAAHYSSKELYAMPADAIGNEQIDLIRTTFDARVSE